MFGEPIVRLENLPTSVHGFVYHDEDDNCFIVLNARETKEMNREAFKHEMEHINDGDMYDPDYREYDE